MGAVVVRCTTLVMFALGGFVLPAAGIAQGTVGSIRGQVLDAESVIADARIGFVNSDTAVALMAVTDARGLYVFPRVSPGRYRIEATRDGFSPARTDVVVNFQRLVFTAPGASIGRRGGQQPGDGRYEAYAQQLHDLPRPRHEIGARRGDQDPAAPFLERPRSADAIRT